MPYGYTGRILKIDLSNRTVQAEQHDDAWYRTYVGGRGVVAHYLLRELPPGIDAFDPRNPLIFAAGPLTGTALSGQGRNGVGAKSPLTNGFGSAEGGGFWGAELKRAGVDALVVVGQADRPTYLLIRNGQAEFREAPHLWGLTTGETEDRLRAELGDRAIRTALIGPAGEKRVRFAAIVNDRSHFVGRTGLGAVMGAKNLKGIVARAPQGKPLMEIKHAAGAAALARWMGANLDMVAGLHEHGTARILRSLSKSGGLPTRNFREGEFEGHPLITGQTMSEQILIKRETCYACAVRCKRVVEVKAGAWGAVRADYGGPEYESLAALGSNAGISDLVALAKANERAAALGMDTISLGATIAYAMEAFENGLLSVKDTGGLELRFGNAAAMLALVERIAQREGLGEVLAEGAARAAAQIGGGEYALTVRGQEIPMHEPRLKAALGVGYAVSPTGADHEHNIHDTGFTKDTEALQWLRAFDGTVRPLPASDLSADKVKLLRLQANWMHAWDTLVMCHFLPYSPQQIADAANAITGWEMTPSDYLTVGERAATLARVFNLREGLGAAYDTLPKRFFQKFERGPLASIEYTPERFAAATLEYYAQMGWDDQGVPTRDKMDQLGVGWAADS